MVHYASWTLIHLAAWAAILLAGAGVGHLFLRRQRFDSFVERWVFSVALGLGLFALALFILGLIGALRRGVILALTGIALTGLLVHSARSFRGRTHSWLPGKEVLLEERTVLVALVVMGVLFYWAPLFVASQFPPIAWDSVAYHLVLAREYLLQHRLIIYPGVPVPLVPALNHMLFTWSLAVKDDVLAQMMEHALMILTAAALYAWGKREGRAGVGLTAAAFWLGTPLVRLLGNSAYVDVGIACYAFLGVYALAVFRKTRDAGWWYLSMALLGMAAGIKLAGLFFLGLAGAYGLWLLVRSRLTLRQAMTGWVLGLVITSPWYAFIAYYSGNPVWPAAASLSTGVWRSASEFVWRSFGNVGVARTPLNFLLLPVHLTLHPAPFLPDNNLALLPLVIVFPVAWIVSVWHRPARWWTLWALAYTFFWFMTSQQLRFWIAVLPFVGLAIFESVNWVVERITKNSVVRVAVWLVLGFGCLQMGTVTTFREIRAKGFRPPTTPVARERFLTGLLTGYAGVLYVNNHCRQGDAVYSMNGSWLNYYFQLRVFDAAALLNPAPRPVFHWPEDQEWLQFLDSQKVNWILVNYAEVPATVKRPGPGSISESFWPGYELVYTDPVTWVFQRRPAGAPLPAAGLSTGPARSKWPAPSGARDPIESLLRPFSFEVH